MRKAGKERRVGYDGTLLTTKNGGNQWNDLKEAVEKRRQALLASREKLVQKNRVLEIGPGQDALSPDDFSTAPDLRTSNAWSYLTLTASWRLPIIIFSLLVVQVLIGLNRYNTRLAAFYTARADALRLLAAKVGSGSIETLERGTWILSPDQVDFGKTPQSLPAQAIELMRRIWANRDGQRRGGSSPGE